MRVIARLFLLTAVLSCANPIMAETTRFAWRPGARGVAQRTSDVLVVSQAALYARDVWRSEDRKHAIGCAALRVGLTMGATEIVKRAVHRGRPDGSDNKSFWSGHSATSMAMSGWRYEVGVPIALGAGYLRAASKKHYISDVLTGWGVGLAANAICSATEVSLQ